MTPGHTQVSYAAGFSYDRLSMPLALLLAFPLRRLCDDAQKGLEQNLRRRFDGG